MIPCHLVVTVHFPLGLFHGRKDGGEPEWPPSPHRLFQALVRAASLHNGSAERSAEHFRWLERLPAPAIVAPRAWRGIPFRIAVPNNDLDIVMAAHARGETPKKQANELRTMKQVQPVQLLADSTVHYVWDVSAVPREETAAHAAALSDIAKAVVALGWGTDHACARAVLTTKPPDARSAEVWLPRTGPGAPALRTPVQGTYDELSVRYRDFLTRLTAAGLRQPQPLSRFRLVSYAPAMQPTPLDFVAFSLLKPDLSGFRPFNVVRSGLTLAGRLRNAVRHRAADSGWSENDLVRVVLGHGETDGEFAASDRRFLFLPLPTLERRSADSAVRVGDIRRVLIAGPESAVAWARARLSGAELVDERTALPVAILGLLPNNDWVATRYTAPSAVWASVTPVILPGFDDPRRLRARMATTTDASEKRRLVERIQERVDRLLRKAMLHAGIPAALAANAELEWQNVAYFPGGERVDRYGVPHHLTAYPRYHVRIRWRDANGRDLYIPGPLSIGSGRYYGVGLFASA